MTGTVQDSQKVALVTGASRGIGAALAEKLGANGYHVIIVARTEAGLLEVDDRIHAAGGTATIAPLDITNFEDVDRLAIAIGERWGRLDLLVLNAATLGTLSPLAHIEPKEFEKIISLNLVAQWRLVRAFDAMLRRARGTVVALSSTVASEPRAYWGGYAVSKAGLEAMASIYAQEMKALGVNVLVVNPGATRTAMRARAYPGEDPQTVKTPAAAADAIWQKLSGDQTPGLSTYQIDHAGDIVPA